MNRITNKQIMDKLEAIQKTDTPKEIIEKINTMETTIQAIQSNISDNTNKEILKKVSNDIKNDIKKSVIINYISLSLVYVGIGLALLLASLEFIALQYSIIFGVFFGGSIVFMSLAYIQKKRIIELY